MGDFVNKVTEMKQRARKNMENGAVTEGYRADRDAVIKLLNTALATEIVCVLRYERHYQMASGRDSLSVGEEFHEHAKEEQEHVDWLAERITQLGGAPDYSPKGLAERAQTDYVECETLEEMIRENLMAERIVIDIYGEMIRFIGNDDPTTRRGLEHILAEEEEHAEELSTLLENLGFVASKQTSRTSSAA